MANVIKKILFLIILIVIVICETQKANAFSSGRVMVGGAITSAQFATSADTWVTAGSPDENRGTDAFMRVSSDSSFPNRSLMKFDISLIPAAARIESALLSIYYFSTVAGTPTGRTYNCYRTTTTSWTEGAVTWNNQPATTSTDGVQETVPALNNWLEYSIVALAEYAIVNDSSIVNVQILDNSEEPGVHAASFYTKEEATQTTLRPKMFIRWNP